MRVTIDTTEAMSFETTEPGPYEMMVEKIDDPAKGEKSTYVTVYYAFQDPTLARKCGHVMRNYPIDGKGAGFFREFWKAATGQDIPINTKIDVDMDDAIGRPVIVEIDHDTYEGKTRNNAAKVTSAT